MMSIDPQRIPKQLRYWTLHCCVNALPSFIIVIVIISEMNRDKMGETVLAMLCAITTFIVAYTLITSIRGWFDNPKGLLSRALKVGTKTRLVISILSLPAVTALAANEEGLLMFCPDYWAGFAAVWIYVASSGMAQRSSGGDPDFGFIDIYAVTMLEGMILSFTLIMISFFALIVLHIRARRRGDFLPSQHAPTFEASERKE